jgi:hypothetical protein
MARSKCPKCSGEFLRRASRRGFERLLSIFFIYPFYCQLCGHRFRLVRWGEMYHKNYYDQGELESRPVSMNVSVWSESGEHDEGTLQELSMRGCRLSSGVAFSEGSIVRLELHVGNDELPIVIQAGVVRNVGSSQSQIEFLQFQHAERERLRELVKNLLAAPVVQSDDDKLASA